ncbi:MAG: radical SAM protein [Deltaproteobacteria bacterium]|jgi:MoaA/NifB/PqqE/SkfB family radical SAM enzyme|nr:radical SAM protein [Deltaproteobacteria bacterium]
MAHDILKIMRMAGRLLARSMIQVNVMVTYECCCRCRICDYWRPPASSRPAMTLEIGRVLAEKLRSIGPLAVCLVGGEPLMHPNLLDLAAPLAKDHFLDMVTNGRFMTPELAKELFRIGFSEIGVSIDYSAPAEHDAQRGLPGLFDRAVSALEYLWAARIKPEQRVRLISVVMEDSLDHIEPLSRLCRKLGVKHNLTLCVCGRGSGRLPADLELTVRRLKEIQKLCPELLILPGYLEGFSGRGRSLCRSGRNLMAVDSEGRLLRCLDRTEAPVGSLLEEDLEVLLSRLRVLPQTEPCDECWTSCRGIVEPLLYGPGRLRNWRYHLRSLRPEPLAGAAGRSFRSGEKRPPGGES